MPYVYIFSTVEKSGAVKVHRHRATTMKIHELHGKMLEGSMRFVREEFVIEGFFKLNIRFYENTSLVNQRFLRWGELPSLH